MFQDTEGAARVSERTVIVPGETIHYPSDQGQTSLADIFELRTAVEMADLLASNDRLLNQILGT
jgi:hypothetical protein